MFHIIYKITNLVNDKIYIGAHSTNDIDDNYMGSGHALRNAQKKYGIENFTKEILHVFDSSDEMYHKEAEIVTESFCDRKDNYNVRVGGIGGWNHYLGTEQHKKSSSNGGKSSAKILKEFIKEQKANNTEWWQNRLKKIIETNQKNTERGVLNGWKNYTDEERETRRQNLSQMQQGSNNCQYGRYWISHPETKEVKRINSDESIPEGWVRGKKGHVPKRIWVNNGITEHYIFVEKLEQHLQTNYTVGRIVKNKNLTLP